jgi:FMN-dependent NADH-azoreductase
VTLLHIDASPRDERSKSRNVGRTFVDAWRAHHPGERVVVRNVGRIPPPFVTEAWVEGAFSPAEGHSPAARETIAVSDAYVDELLEADHLFISTPMHNFCGPAMLKAWIDQVVRIDRTVKIVGDGFEGLAVGKRATVLVTSSRDPRPESATTVNIIEPYLRAALAFMAIEDVRFVYAHSQNSGPASERVRAIAARAREEARAELERLAADA